VIRLKVEEENKSGRLHTISLGVGCFFLQKAVDSPVGGDVVVDHNSAHARVSMACSIVEYTFLERYTQKMSLRDSFFWEYKCPSHTSVLYSHLIEV
jgi:hypothetical protein